ncbi:MAG TPA: tripartite tricarboxylate transporter TctB family protein [Xanthobacteraceae bacterium]
MQRIQLHINKDVVAGLMFMAWGVAGLWIARRYPMGTAMRMGPGYFPVVLCWLLIIFGLGIAARGAVTEGERLTSWYWRPLTFIMLAFLVFAALIDRAGLAPAGFASVVVGALGGPEFRLREALLLALALTAGAVALFIYALGLPMKLWPL